MKKKILALCLVVALCATAIVSGTLAYFTDVTEEKQNTFTVGNVNIDLSEPKWDANTKHVFMPGTTFEKDPTITVADNSQSAWLFMEVKMNKFNSWLRLVAIEHDQKHPNEPNLIDFNDQCTICKDSCQGHLNATNLKAALSDKTSRDAFIGSWFSGWNTDYTIMNGKEVLDSLEKSWTDPSIKVLNPIFGFNNVKNAGEKVVFFTGVGMPSTVDSKDLAYSRFNTDKTEWKLTFKAHAIQSENIKDQQTAYYNLFPTE